MSSSANIDSRYDLPAKGRQDGTDLNGYPLIPLFKVFVGEESIQAVNAVLRSGYIGQGPKVEEFEADLVRFFSNPHVVTLNSATSGLTLAMRLARDELGPGEVLTTPLTCTATNWAVLAAGMTPRWTDVESESITTDLEDLRRQLSPRTRAILVVHWGGYPNDLDALRSIQLECNERYGVLPYLVEDCAHAWGSTYKGKILGNHDNVCVFSLQAIKHVTAGDGGVMVLPERVMYRKAQLLRWYGIDRDTRTHLRCEGDIADWGYKFHMNDINAAIGCANLKHATEVVRKHRANAAYFKEHLMNVAGVTLPKEDPNRGSSYWVFTVRVERRAEFEAMMRDRGVMVSPVHKRNDLHSCVREYRRPDPLPGVDALDREMICLPVGWWLTEKDRERIVDAVRGGW